MNKIKLYILICMIFVSKSFGTFDYKVPLDESGIWGYYYDIPKYTTIAMLSFAMYEGSESRIGKTTWQSLDAGLMSQTITEAIKRGTGRLRPRNSNNPHEWLQGGMSFVSGHASGMTALVTPFILEYKDDYPWVHLLWGLPLYVMEGRIKSQAHWQSDVIGGAIVGFLSGYWAHKRKTPLLLYFNNGNTFIGLKYKF